MTAPGDPEGSERRPDSGQGTGSGTAENTEQSAGRETREREQTSGGESPKRERTTGAPSARADDVEARREGTDVRQLSLPLETLAVLNWLGDSGLGGAEDRLNTVLDDDLTVQTEQVKIGYAEQETVSAQFGADEVAGARVLLSKPLVGNVLVVFPMESANKAAALMLQRAVEDLSSVSTEMGRDALTELCNMMANGFVDEWATLFETTIDTGSPVSVQAPERTLVRRILKQYELGLYITSRLTIPEYDLEGTVYVFPGRPEFVSKMSRVGLGVIE